MKKLPFIILLLVGTLVLYLFFLGSEGEKQSEVQQTKKDEVEHGTSTVDVSKLKKAELQEETLLVASEPENSKVIPDFPINSMPLFFPKDLDRELKQVIALDLSIVYGDIEDFEILEVDPPLVATSAGVKYELNEYIDFRGSGRYFPDEIGGIYIYETTIGRQVFVSDQIIEAYRIAKNRRDENPVIFKRLEDFLDVMNHLDRVSVEAPEGRFYLFKEAKMYEKEMMETLSPKSFQDAYGRYRYRTPSLLEVKKGKEFDSLLQDLGDKFVAKVYAYDQSDKISDGSPPFVYDEGQWKLLIVIPGT